MSQGLPSPRTGHRMSTEVLLLRKVGREHGQQSEICHRQRDKTQSPHPRSLASQPNQTHRTLRPREQDRGGSWSAWERPWRSTERAVGLDEDDEEGEEAHPARGKIHSAPFSVASLLRQHGAGRDPCQPRDPEKRLLGPACLFNQPGMTANSPGATAIWTLGTRDQPKQCGGGSGPAGATRCKPPAEPRLLVWEKTCFSRVDPGTRSGEATLISAATPGAGGRGRTCARGAVWGGCHRGRPPRC